MKYMGSCPLNRKNISLSQQPELTIVVLQMFTDGVHIALDRGFSFIGTEHEGNTEEEIRRIKFMSSLKKYPVLGSAVK
jgi:hypothetical protein